MFSFRSTAAFSSLLIFFWLLIFFKWNHGRRHGDKRLLALTRFYAINTANGLPRKWCETCSPSRDTPRWWRRWRANEQYRVCVVITEKPVHPKEESRIKFLQKRRLNVRNGRIAAVKSSIVLGNYPQKWIGEKQKPEYTQTKTYVHHTPIYLGRRTCVVKTPSHFFVVVKIQWSSLFPLWHFDSRPAHEPPREFYVPQNYTMTRVQVNRAL